MTTLKSLANKKVLVLKIHASLFEAAKAMESKSVGCALVSDGKGQIVGLITDRDIACRGIGSKMSGSEKISSLVHQDLIYIGENRSLSEATKVMQHFGIRRLPVIKNSPGGKSKCIGILSFDDLVFSGAVPLDELAEIIRSQMSRPKKRPVKNPPELFFIPKELQPISTPI